MQWLSEIGIPVVIGFGASVPGYQKDGYIRASRFVLYPYGFVVGPTNTIVLVVHRCVEISVNGRLVGLKGKYAAVYHTDLDGPRS